MDEIDRRFTNIILDSSYDPAIRAAMRFAKATLNRYYSLTDLSEPYRNAMGMFPSPHLLLLTRLLDSVTSDGQVRFGPVLSQIFQTRNRTLGSVRGGGRTLNRTIGSGSVWSGSGSGRSGPRTEP